ncbi:MAG: Flp pilus assembly protein CpaB [Kiritimatiellae bacterium]|nr:Flp pilus assembly protein CpaB [Kiritimatiellia bacterium]
MKRHIVLAIALVAGIAAAVMTRLFISAKNAEVGNEQARLARKYGTVKVVAYTRDIPAGTILGLEDLGQREVPKVGLRGQAVEIGDFRQLIGRRTLVPNEAKEVVFWSDIEGGNPSTKGMSVDIKRQMRAVSIGVSLTSSVSGMIRPNDHVDVIGTFDFPADEDRLKRGDPVTCTILQNVLVLATGHDTAKSSDRSLGASQGYSTVTLEVTPREAEMLAFAEQIRGRLVLTLRNPNDTSMEKELPTVNFDKIREELTRLNEERRRSTSEGR